MHGDMHARDVFLSINANLVSPLSAFRRGTPLGMRAGFHQEIATCETHACGENLLLPRT